MKSSRYKDILEGYNLKNDQVAILTKLIDRASLCDEKNIIKYMDFLDPYLSIVSEEVLSKYFNNINYEVSGGYKGAERKIVMLYPDSIEYLQLPLRLIKINSINDKNISHRDVLGSVLGLGLKREKIGDIIISNNIIQVIVFDEIADFIDIHLKKIGKYNVNTEVTNLNNIIPKIEEYKNIYGNVKSLRLDSICSEGFGISRNRTSKDIKNDKIKVNFRPVTSPSYDVREGDLVSYRGNGRIVLEEILGKTKKDRLRILIKKYI